VGRHALAVAAARAAGVRVAVADLADRAHRGAATGAGDAAASDAEVVRAVGGDARGVVVAARAGARGGVTGPAAGRAVRVRSAVAGDTGGPDAEVVRAVPGDTLRVRRADGAV